MRKPLQSVTQAAYELLADLRHSLRLFSSFSEQAARAARITPTQHQALLAIKGSRLDQPISIGELADHLCTRHHSAVGLVDRLVARGFIRRVLDPADRRRVRLSLSRRGENVIARLSVAHRDELVRVGPHIQSLLERLRRDIPATSKRRTRRRRG